MNRHTQAIFFSLSLLTSAPLFCSEGQAVVPADEASLVHLADAQEHKGVALAAMASTLALEVAYAEGRQAQTQQEQSLASTVAKNAASMAALELKKQENIAARDAAVATKADVDALLAEYAAGADEKNKQSADLTTEINARQAAIDGIQAALDGQKPKPAPARASGWFSWFSRR